MSNMLKGIASDLTGASDICLPLTDLSKALANNFLMPKETVLFCLQSSKEEFAFTNNALIKISASSATTTRKLVTRYEYRTHWITSVKFETAGRIDRDCEIKLTIAGDEISIDIARNEEEHARIFYKVLLILGRQQSANERKWEFAKLALDQSAKSMRVNDPSVKLTSQADTTLTWMQELYEQTHPRDYREVILNAFELVGSAKSITSPAAPASPAASPAAATPEKPAA